MNIENPKLDRVDNKEEFFSRGKTSTRLMFALDKLKGTIISGTKVEGRENLKEIPQDKKVIIVTTHITDADAWLPVCELGNDFDIAITDVSTHHKAFGKDSELPTNIGLRIAGKENFLPIDYKKGEEGKNIPSKLNPGNFIAMQEALEKGKAVLVAAHNPSHRQQLEKGGYGAVYLAELADAVILPVAVDMEDVGIDDMYKNPGKLVTRKPSAKITIGKPLTLEKIENFSVFSKVLQKRKKGESISPEELQEFSKIKKTLVEKSDSLMRHLATMVPPEKRGPYA